jgi:hypothetical protein
MRAKYHRSVRFRKSPWVPEPDLAAELERLQHLLPPDRLVPSRVEIALLIGGAQ